MDGNNAQIDAINARAAEYQVDVPILIDFIHITQYLWKAAGSFFCPGDPAARAWVRAQAAKILAGKARDVWTGIRRRATSYGYSTKEREGADTCASYLENKKDYLGYPAFLAAGWPVASGLIEGAARWLIKDRMEVTGARWSLDGAEAVLKLRALVGNGDFDDYFGSTSGRKNSATTTAAIASPNPSRHDHPHAAIPAPPPANARNRLSQREPHPKRTGTDQQNYADDHQDCTGQPNAMDFSVPA